MSACFPASDRRGVHVPNIFGVNINVVNSHLLPRHINPNFFFIYECNMCVAIVVTSFNKKI